MKYILNKISYFFETIYWFLYLILSDTKFGIFMLFGSIGLFVWYGATYEPGWYCEYCGECYERYSHIYYHPCKEHNNGKHNRTFYWKKPANGYTHADELTKYME